MQKPLKYQITFRKMLGVMSLALLLCFLLITPAQAYYLAPGFLDSGDFDFPVTTPGKWGPAVIGTGASVSWSFMATGTLTDSEASDASFTALADFMPGGFKAEIEAAFDAWSAVADLTFTEVPDLGEPFDAFQTSGDIRIGGHTFDGSGGTLAHGYYPPFNGTSAAGDIHFDIDDTWVIGFPVPGFDIFQVAAHEIGHAIGLGHEEDVVALMNPSYTEAFSGLQADDIAGAIHIYGAPVVVPIPPAVVLLIGPVIGLIGYRQRQRRPSKDLDG